MKNKNCTWCEQKLGLVQLLLLDDHSPTICKRCGKNLRNNSTNLIASIVVLIVLCSLSLYLFDFGIIFVPFFLLMIPALRILLAEPIKYNR